MTWTSGLGQAATPRLDLGTVLKDPSPAPRQYPLPPVLDTPAPEGDDAPKMSSEASGLRAELLSVAETYGKATYVPYIWGGDAIGSADTCNACRACVASKKKLRVDRRRAACSACKSCGVDCTHFLNRVYREAGMGFPYAATRALQRATPAQLKAKYHLVNVGNDLRLARPGDMILHQHHVTFLLRMRDAKVGDILHASRSNTKRGVGGIEIRRSVDLTRFRGRILRILRPEALYQEDRGAPAPQQTSPETRDLIVGLPPRSQLA